jgi:ketosteroid isomerase-like protein
MPETATYRWQPLGGEVSRDGKSGYTFGVAAVGISTGSATPIVRLDRYLAFWRRSADGVWRVAAYSEVGSLPVPAETQPTTSELAPTLALPRGRRAEAAQQVREADSAFSLAADLQGTGVAFSSFVAPQGVVFAGTELVVGTDAVKAFYDDQQRAGGALNWRPVFADATDSGDLGMTVGEYVFTGHGPTGAIVQRFGKYLTIWKRQPGGEWRFVVDGGSGSPTPGGRD